MSCPAELELSVYVDDELAPTERRSVESHLIGCRPCRARVLALQDESALLGDVLHGREAPAPRPEAELPEPGLALGLPLAVAAVTAALTVASFLLETRLPGGFDLFNPLRLKGAYEMVFDLIFMLRDRAPGLLELAVSVGAVASLSALGTFAVGALYRRLEGAASLLLLLLAVLLAPWDATALDLRMSEDVHVAAGETIPETLVVTCDNVHVDGVVDGDLVVAAHRVTVRGTVTGSLYVFTRDLEVAGVVGGGIHVIAERARIGGRVAGGVYALAEKTTLAAGASIARDVAIFGAGAVVDGSVERDVSFAGDWLEVSGSVTRNLDVLAADRVTLLGSARVGGDLRAVLDDPEAVERMPGAQVAGAVRVEPRDPIAQHYLSHYRHWQFYLLQLVEMAAAFAFGLLAYLLVPRVFDSPVPGTRGFFRSLGFGFLALVAVPLGVVAVALTVVGIPISVLGVFVYLTSIYLGHILVGEMLGRALLGPRQPGLSGFGLALLLGVAVLGVVTAVPFLGPAVWVVVVLFGLGLLVERARIAAAPAWRAV